MTNRSSRSWTTFASVHRARVCGASLVELVVALAVTGVLAGVSFRLLDRTHRYSRGIALLLEERAQIAAAASVVRGALEEVAPLDGDLAATPDSSVVFDGAVGHAIACATATSSIDVPTATLASQLVLTAWSTAPQSGDVVAVLDDGALPGAQDDVWHRRTVAAVLSLPNACQSTPLIDSIADAGSVGWRLVLSLPIPSTVHPGVPVHVIRRQRFALYRSGSEWMVGWTEWNTAGGGWNVIQPLAGPLLPYAPPGGASGISFAWRDSSGAPTTLPGGSAPIAATISVRGPTRAPVRVDGMRAGIHLDSLGVRVAARNRR
jgi:hypothetical protein